MKRGLKQVVAAAGYTVRYASYFNTLLFPLIAGMRGIKKLTGDNEADFKLPSAPANSILQGVFASERLAVSSRLPMPIGVSLILLAENAQQVMR